MWLTESNALLKSKHIPHENFDVSIAFCILSIIKIVVRMVECFDRKPNWLVNNISFLLMKLNNLLCMNFSNNRLKFDNSKIGL